MSSNIRADRIIQQRLVDDIQNRLDTYFQFLGGNTSEDWDKSQIAREKICDWAVGDLITLIRERKSLILELNDIENFLTKIQSRPNCNDCGTQKECEYRPKWGTPVVYGCPLWRSEQSNTLG